MSSDIYSRKIKHCGNEIELTISTRNGLYSSGLRINTSLNGHQIVDEVCIASNLAKKKRRAWRDTKRMSRAVRIR